MNIGNYEHHKIFCLSLSWPEIYFKADRLILIQSLYPAYTPHPSLFNYPYSTTLYKFTNIKIREDFRR